MALFKYFVAPFTEVSIKDQFRKQSMKLHPDKGGDESDFIAMKAEFEKVVLFAAKGKGRKKILLTKSNNKKPFFTKEDREWVEEMMEFAKFAVKNKINETLRKIHDA